MATLRLFGPVREAAGVGEVEIVAGTVADVVAVAVDRFGTPFAMLLERSRIWVNGEVAEPTCVLGDTDEVAIIPPVSGG